MNGKIYMLTFQFPSNGKVYSEPIRQILLLLAYRFQFPSNGKVYSEHLEGNWHIVSRRNYRFNSLQTGKCIQSKAAIQTPH